MCLVFYRYQFTPTPEEIESTIAMMESDLKKLLRVLHQLRKSYSETNGRPKMDYVRMPPPVMNPQTVNICSKLGIDDPVALLLGTKKNSMSSPRVTPPRSGLNSSELNITLESSKLSVTNVDEIEGSDDDTGDIIMEMRLSPDPEDKPTNTIEEVVSPIRGDNILQDEATKGQPASSSPKMPVPRRGLRLSEPKMEMDGSSPLHFSIDSSSASSLSEGEFSPSQSPGTKRTNDESEKEVSQASVSSSSASSEGNKTKNKKRETK
ncbi:uncharacterized protein LOC135217713 [Macrobrachium nipponense]|uniref:uncharacterized protein LOC135217713 n=1 Tax=Macrobrachium nipponense TaxID=159736 RepID=UPI0030C7B734